MCGPRGHWQGTFGTLSVVLNAAQVWEQSDEPRGGVQVRLERLAQTPVTVSGEVSETEDDHRECPPLSDEELLQLVNSIADLIELRASLERHAPLLDSWRSQFLAQSSGADVLSVLQQARAVSELADASAFELAQSVTAMVRMSEGMQSDRLFLLQLRRKYLDDNLTL